MCLFAFIVIMKPINSGDYSTIIGLYTKLKMPSLDINGCHRNLSSVRRFVNHIRVLHKDFYRIHYVNAVENVGNDANELVVNHGIMGGAPEQHVGLQDQGDVDMQDVQNVGLPMQIDLRPKVVLFLLKLRELHKVPGSVCSFVASEIVNILQMSKTKMHSQLDAALLEDDVNRDEIATALAVIKSTELEDIFHSFEDNRKLSSYVQSEFPFVEPIEFVLGADVGGKCEFYIPILETLKLLLQNEDVLAEVVQSHKSEDGKLKDFCDGTIFRENELFAFDSSSLQVVLYYDVFNIVNPPGNKVKNYKYTNTTIQV